MAYMRTVSEALVKLDDAHNPIEGKAILIVITAWLSEAEKITR